MTIPIASLVLPAEVLRLCAGLTPATAPQFLDILAPKIPGFDIEGVKPDGTLRLQRVTLNYVTGTHADDPDESTAEVSGLYVNTPEWEIAPDEYGHIVAVLVLKSGPLAVVACTRREEGRNHAEAALTLFSNTLLDAASELNHGTPGGGRPKEWVPVADEAPAIKVQW